MNVRKTTFDTNICVSYFISKRFQELVELVFEHHIALYRSKISREELEDVLR